MSERKTYRYLIHGRAADPPSAVELELVLQVVVRQGGSTYERSQVRVEAEGYHASVAFAGGRCTIQGVKGDCLVALFSYREVTLTPVMDALGEVLGLREVRVYDADAVMDALVARAVTVAVPTKGQPSDADLLAAGRVPTKRLPWPAASPE